MVEFRLQQRMHLVAQTFWGDHHKRIDITRVISRCVGDAARPPCQLSCERVLRRPMLLRPLGLPKVQSDCTCGNVAAFAIATSVADEI